MWASRPSRFLFTRFSIVQSDRLFQTSLVVGDQLTPSLHVSAGTQLLPKEIVAQLDKYIVGQQSAKKAVAVALRNRWRRSLLSDSMRKEVSPKNILMVGPSGVGKTEIARRLAKLCNAPFIKVEATKYTEVGFHGKDVDHIIKDLLNVGITETKKAIVSNNQSLVRYTFQLFR